MLVSRALKSVDPKVAFLRSLPGLAGIRDRDLVALASLFDEARVDAGRVLIREGASGREMFLVVEGQAAVTLRGDFIATVGPGEFVGEMAVFERAPRSATVTALTPMRLLVAGSQSFGTLLAHPAMLRRLATTLARRLRVVQGSPEEWSEDPRMNVAVPS